MVLAEIRKLIEDLSLDVICLQEPYSSKSGIPHMPITARVVREGDAPMAATIIVNKQIKVARVSQYCNSHINCTEIVTPSGAWILVNMYVQYGEVLDLSIMRAIARAYTNVPMIIMADANAKSPWWYSNNRDERGEQFEDFIAEFGLNIENKPHNPYTFESRAGTYSNIDITLTNNIAHDTIMNWRVGQGLTTSDHNVILFDVSSVGVRRDGSRPGLVHDIKRANWNKLKLSLMSPTQIEVGDDVDQKAKEVTIAIRAAMNQSIPKSKAKTKSNTYKPWTDKLQNLRTKARRTRRSYQRTRVEADRLIRLQEYRVAKYNFREELKKTRLVSWQNYVEKSMALDAWGTPYKLATNKIRHPEIISTLVKDDGSVTMGWRDSVELLLNGLLPSDNEVDETDEQKTMRRTMTESRDLRGVVYPFAVEEVRDAILLQKKKKAPGPDGIKSEVLHCLVSEISPYLCDLFNECLTQGRIPDCFKEANMVVLSKGEDKNPQLLKSYRPICLINILGKIQERLLCGRLRDHRKLHGMVENQFGFRKGKSTEDAIIYALESAGNSNCRYVIGIFIDISGAFDNLWWPYLFSCLRRMDCPRNLYLSLLDYCKNRKVQIVDFENGIGKITSKGCPQGSILGPEFWDINLEPLLVELQQVECIKSTVAYADDLLVLIEANNRISLEQRSREALAVINDWCKTAKLKIAANKTTYMLLRGSLQRDPIIKIGDQTICRSRQTKYLGVHIDEKLGFREHVEIVRTKGEKVMMKLAGIGQRRFHLPLDILQLYHNTILASVVSYGAGIWAHRANDKRIKRQLRSTQRRILLRFVGAFGTTSTMALLVVLGVWPLDFQIRLRGALYWLKKQNYVKINTIIGKRVNTKVEIKQALLTEWQEEWNYIQEGRRTYGIFPDVRQRLRLKHVRPGQGLVHFLTGHGPYGVYFKRINSLDSDVCQNCQLVDTPEHAVFECVRSLGLEAEARNRLTNHTIGDILLNEGLFKDLNTLTDSFSKLARENRQNIQRRRRHIADDDVILRRSQRLANREN